MSGLRTLVCCAALGAAAAAASANSVVGTTLGSNVPGWRAFPGSLNNYDNPNRPYWDQRSLDGSNKNIGNYVNGSYVPPAPNVPGPGTPLPWWGYSSLANNVVQPLSNEDSSWYFSGANSLPNQQQSSLLCEVASLRNFNEVGWYNTADAPGHETLHVIYRGGDNPLFNTAFTPTGNWGLYLRSWKNFGEDSGKGLYYFSQAGRNRATGFTESSVPEMTHNRQHFALFALDLTPGREAYLVGSEDLPGNTTECGGDYNDVVFKLRTVPEPASLLLLAGGALLSALRRR